MVYVVRDVLNEELEKIYVDEDGNIQFLDQYLEEIVADQPTVKKDNLLQILEKLAEATIRNEGRLDLKNVSEKSIFEKFTSKNPNALQWIENFETECARFNITEDGTKIEILRLFLNKSCSD